MAVQCVTVKVAEQPGIGKGAFIVLGLVGTGIVGLFLATRGKKEERYIPPAGR